MYSTRVPPLCRECGTAGQSLFRDTNNAASSTAAGVARLLGLVGAALAKVVRASVTTMLRCKTSITRPVSTIDARQ